VPTGAASFRAAVASNPGHDLRFNVLNWPQPLDSRLAPAEPSTKVRATANYTRKTITTRGTHLGVHHRSVLRSDHGTGARRWLRERAYVLAIVVIVVILTVSGLSLYAMRAKIRLKISATALKWFSFSIEVESQDRRQSGELPPS
jgi:hypothetical protein